MNKIFRVIWNHATQTWTAVSELAKCHGKVSSQTDKRQFSQGENAPFFKLSLLSAVILGAFFSFDAYAWKNEDNFVNLTASIPNTVVVIGAGASYKASAAGDFSVSIGQGANAAGRTTVAIGSNAQTLGGGDSVAIGASATASANNATVIGVGAKASGHATAIGNLANASTGTQSVAIGSAVNVSSGQAIGIGNDIVVTGHGAIALGGDDVGVLDDIDDTIQGIKGIKQQYDGNWADSDQNRPYGEQVGESKLYVKTAATGRASIAIGAQSQTTADWTTAIGARSFANKEAGTAVGVMSKATGNASFAGGFNATAGAGFTVALGANATASQGEAIAIGYDSKATNFNATALGFKANATQRDATALGSNATSTGESATAVGRNSLASGPSSVAVGKDAVANRENSIALGVSANATGWNTIAIGRDAKVDTRTKNNGGIAIGKNAISLGNGNLAFGTSSYAGTDPALIPTDGSTTYPEVEYSMAIGDIAKAHANRSLALGVDSLVQNLSTGAIAIGNGTKVFDKVISASNTQGSNQAIAIGYTSNITGAPGAVILGSQSDVKSKHGVSLGYNADIGENKEGAVVLGANSGDTGSATTLATTTSATIDHITYSGFSGAIGTTNNQGRFVSIGNNTAGGQRKLINLAAGEVSPTSTEAINGSQLYALALKQARYFSVNSSLADNRGNNGAVGGNSIAIGPKASTAEANGIAIGNNTAARGSGDVVIGNNITTSNTNGDKGRAVVIGENASATGGQGVALGSTTKAAAQATAIGNEVSAEGRGSIAIGADDIGGSLPFTDNIQGIAGLHAAYGDKYTNTKTTAAGGIAIGAGAQSTGVGAAAIGTGSRSSGILSAALGPLASATADLSVAIGVKASATQAGGVALGTDSLADRSGGDTYKGYDIATNIASTETSTAWKPTYSAVSVGKSGATRQIINVAAGKEDTDAVNVAQLKKARISTTYKADGGLSNNALNTADHLKSYEVKSGDTKNIEFLSSLDWGTGESAFGGNNIEILHQANGKFQFGIKKQPTFDKLTITSGPVLSSTGIAMGNKKISGLLAGTDATDAVNKGQLDAIVGTLTFKGEKKLTGENADDVGTAWRSNTAKTLTIGSSQNWGGGDNRYSGDNLEILRLDDSSIHIGLKTNLTTDSISISNNGPKLSGTGLDMKSKTISNLTSGGTTDTNAANIADVKRLAAAEVAKIPTAQPLKFRGDDNQDVSRNLGQTLSIKGGSTAATLTDKNIKVTKNTSNDGLTIQMAKNLTDLTDATFGDATANNLKLSNTGLTLTTTGATSPVQLLGSASGGQLTGLESRLPTVTDYGTGTNAGRAATESAVKSLADSSVKKDASNLGAADITKWKEKIDTNTQSVDKVENGADSILTVTSNGDYTDGAVKGKKYTVALTAAKVVEAVQPELNKKLDKDPTNLSEEDKAKWKAAIDTDTVSIEKVVADAGSGITVGEVERNDNVKGKKYTLSLNADKIKELAGTTNLATQLGNKANISLDNINDAGKTKIKGLTKVVGSGDISVAKDTEGDAQKFTVSLTADAKAKLDAVNNKVDQTTYNADKAKFANTDLSNITPTGENKIKGLIEVKAKDGDNNLAKVTKATPTTGNKDVYEVKVTKDDLVTKLGDTFAKADATNITGDNVNKWKTALGVSDLNLHYKANQETTTKTTALSTGLHFKGSDGISINTAENGVVNFGIANGGITKDKLANDVKTAINNVDNKANKDATGLSDEDKAKWKAAIDTVSIEKVFADTNSGITVSEADRDDNVKGKKYTLSLNEDKIKELAGTTDLATQLGNKANISLDNINDAGKTKIKGLTKVVGSGDIDVAESTEGEAQKFTVSLSRDAKTKLDAVNNKVEQATYEADKANFAKTDLSNINTNGENKIKGLIEVKAKDGDNNLAKVTKAAPTTDNKDVYEVEVTKDDLVTKLGDTFAKSDASNITGDNVNKWKTALGVSDLNLHYKADNETGTKTTALSTGLHFKGSDGISINTENGGVVNFSIADGGIAKDKLADDVKTAINNVDNKANKDATGLSEDDKAKWKAAIDTTSVELVTAEANSGITVSNAVDRNDGTAGKKYTLNLDQTKIKDLAGTTNLANDLANKADKNLGNIDEDGKTVIKNAAKSAVKVTGVGDKVTVNKETETDGVDNYKVSVDMSHLATKDALSGTKLKYQANGDTAGTTPKEVLLSTGLNFHSEDLSVTTAENGKVSFAIKDNAITADKIANDAVTGDKIQNGAVTENKLGDDVKNKIAAAKTVVAVDPAADGVLKLTTGTEGQATKYTLSVNGAKLKEMAGTTDLDDRFNGKADKTTAFSLKVKESDATDGTKEAKNWTLANSGDIVFSAGDGLTASKTAEGIQYDLTDAHKATLTKVETQGIAFSGDSGTAQTKKLGESIAVKGGETDESKLTATTDKNIGVVAGANGLEVKLAKNLTALETVTASEKVTVSKGDNKVDIKPNEIAFGKDGTNGKGKITGLADPEKGADGNIDKTQAANVGYVDSKLGELGDKPLSFTGNDTATKVDRKLGETLTIEGEGSTKDGWAGKASAANNLYVAAETGKLVVKLAKDLVNLDSVTVGTDTAGTKITKDGSTIKDADGNTNEVAADGTHISNTDGRTADYDLDGVNLVDGDKSVEITPDGISVDNGTDQATYNADGSSVTDGTDTTTTKADGVTVKSNDPNNPAEADLSKDGLTVKGNKGEATYGQDGLTVKGTDGTNAISLTNKDGNTPTLEFAKNGNDGTGVITGLKDLDPNADGSSAANKNYVDNKFTALSDNPLSFTGNNDTVIVKRKLGEKLIVEGEKTIGSTKDWTNTAADNIYVQADNTDNKLVVKLAKDLVNLDSVTVGTDTAGTKITKDGSTIKDGNGNSVENTALGSIFEDKDGNNAALGATGAEFADKDGNEAVHNAAGSVIKDTDGNTNEVKADGTHIANDDGRTADYDLDGVNLVDGEKSVEITTDGISVDNGTDQATYNADGSTVTDGTDTTTTKADGVTVKSNDPNNPAEADLSKDGLTVKGDKGEATYGQDGLTVKGKDGNDAISLMNKEKDGTTTPTLEFAKNGDDGTGVITGLKDLADDADGSSATNKNYVDNKLSALGDKPLSFTGNDTATKVDRKLGETLTIEGEGSTKDGWTGKATAANNLYVESVVDAAANTAKLVVKLAKDLVNLDSVTVGTDTAGTKMTKDGTSIKDGNGNSVENTALGSIFEDKDGNNAALGATGAEFADKDGNEAVHNAAGSVIKDTDGNTNEVAADGTHISNVDGRTADYDLDGVNLVDGDKSVEITPDGISVDNGTDQATYNADGSTVTDGTDTTTTKADGVTVKGDKGEATYGQDGLTVKGKDGNDAISLVNKEKDGTTTPTLEFAKNGDNGTGVITGLKDLADDADGSSATNKNYVDNKLSALGDKPLSFTGNDTATKVDRKLGETLTIEGEGSTKEGWNGKASAENNLYVEAVTGTAKLVVKLAKDLVNLNSVTVGTDNEGTKITKGGTTIKDGNGNTAETTALGSIFEDKDGNNAALGATGAEFADKDGNEAIHNATGSVIKDTDGNTNEVAADGTHIANDDGRTADYDLDGVNLVDGDKSVEITTDGVSVDNGTDQATYNADGSSVTDGTDTTTTKADGVTVKSNDPNNPAEADLSKDGTRIKGLDGKTANYTLDGSTIDDGQGNTVETTATGTTVTDADGNSVETTALGTMIEDKEGNLANHNAKSTGFLDKDGNMGGYSAKGVELEDADGNSTSINAAGTSLVDVDGNTASHTAAGSTLNDTNGNTNEVKADGTHISNTDGRTADYDLDGVKLVDGDKSVEVNVDGTTITDGESTTETGADGLTVTADDPNDNSKAHYGKDGLTVKGKDGKDAISLVNKEKDGTTTPTLEFGKDPDGKGTGVITGLKDLADDADGSSATNKNYVDNKVNKATDGTSGIVVYTDGDGNRLVKENGKFYKANAQGEKVGDEVTADKVIASLVNPASMSDKQSVGTATKLSNIAKGKIAQGSNEAVNGSQLSNLGYHLGLEVNKDGTGFKAPQLSALEGSTTTPTNVVDALNAATDKLNEGITLVGNNHIAGIKATEINKNLGEVFTIVGGYTGTEASANNLRTVVKNGVLEIQMTEKPVFTEVAATDKVTVGTGNETAEITKDGTRIKGLDGKTANYTLDGSTIDDGQGNKVETTTTGTTVTDADGNSVETTALGTMIEDKEGNIANHNAKSTGFLDKDGNMGGYSAKGVELEDADGNTASHTAAGSTLSDTDGNTNEVKADGSHIANDDGRTADYDLDGVKLVDGDKSVEVNIDGTTITDGETTTETGADGLTVTADDPNDNSEAHYGKDGLTVKGKDGKDAISLTNKDNGAPTLEFGKDPDGKGTGVITGLKDLADDADGSTATNKNYVDNKVNKATDGTSGIVVYTDTNGNRLVKENGKFYKANAQGEKEGDEVQPKDVIASLVNPASMSDKQRVGTATKLSNIAKGKIAQGSNEAVNGSQLSNLGYHLGLEVNKDGTGFKAPQLSALEGSTTTPTNVVDALNAATDKLNEGITLVGNNHIKGIKATEINKNLGEVFTIVGGYTGTEASANNLRTAVKNGVLEIQMTEKPVFTEVTATDKVTVGTGDETAEITKDGTRIKGLDGKTANYTLDGSTIDDGQGNKVETTATGTTVTDADGNSVETTALGTMIEDKDGNLANHNAKSTGFLDKDGNMGGYSAKGVELEDADGNSTSINASGTSLADVDGNTASHTAAGSTLSDTDGNTNEVKADGTHISNTDGRTADYDLDGVKLVDGDKSVEVNIDGTTITDGETTTETGADGLTVTADDPNDNSEAHYGKDGLTVKGKDGKDAISLTNKDNGAPTLEFAKNGNDGTGVITGLKDLADDADGSTATNKNYVDNKLTALSNKPLSFTGNDTATNVDRKLGETLTIEGEGSTKDGWAGKASAENNLYVEAVTDTAKLVVKLAKDLVNLNSVTVGTDTEGTKITKGGTTIKDGNGNTAETTALGSIFEDKDGNNAALGATGAEFADKDGNEAIHNATGSVIKDPDGNTNEVAADGTHIANDDGRTADYDLDGVNLVDGDKSVEITTDGISVDNGTDQAAYNADGSSVTDGTDTTTTKADGVTVKSNDPNNPAEADLSKDGTRIKGLDGKTANYTLDGSTIDDGQGNKVETTATGSVIKDTDGNTNEVKADGTHIANDDGRTADYDLDGVKLVDGDKSVEVNIDGTTITDGETTTETGADGLTVTADDPNDNSEAHYGKDGLTVKGKDGKDAISLTNKDNGAPTLEFAKDGKDGTGVITGLKDLADDADGSSATNKNYVDNKVNKATDGTSGIVVYTDGDGNRLVKENGKFYKVDNSGQKVGDEVQPKDVIASLVNPASMSDKQNVGTATKLSNIAKGKIAQGSNEAVNGSQLSNLGYHLGLEVNKDGIGFKAPQLSALEGSTTTPTNVVDALNAATDKLNEGITLVGNNHINGLKATEINKNLGEVFTIVGGYTGTEASANNLRTVVKNGVLEIQMTEKPVFTEVTATDKVTVGTGNETAEITKDGTRIKGLDGKTANYTLDGSTIDDGQGNAVETTALYNRFIDKDGNLSNHNARGTGYLDSDGNVGSYNAKGVELVDIDGNEAAYTAKGIDYAKEGEKGTGTITGLKDLDDQSHGTTAVNKNYVDGKFTNIVGDVTQGDVKLDKDGNILTKDEVAKDPSKVAKTIENVLVDSDGKPVFVTHNVDGRGEYIQNDIASAVRNMNEQGIKYFHTNDGTNRNPDLDDVFNKEDAKASGKHSTAVGYQAHADGESALAMGNNAVASAYSIAIGPNAKATGKRSVSVGIGNIVEADSSGAFGDPNYIDGKVVNGQASVSGSYAVGNNNVINSSNTFVLGNNVNNSGRVDSTGKPVAMGDTVENSVYLGDRTTATKGNGVGTRNRKANGEVGQTTTAGDRGTVERAVVGGITYGGFAGATANGVVSVGASGSERRIQNVAAGEISPTSTDAINGSQLYSVSNTLTQGINNMANDVNMNFKRMNNRINDVDRKLRSGIAGAVAMGSLVQAYHSGESLLTVGTGAYRNASALAVGYSRVSDNGKVIIKVSGSVNNVGHYMGGASVGYSF